MKKSQKKAIAVGAGVTALAAAAAGAYFFTGKRGVKNRKKVSGWANSAKKEVMSEMHKMEKVSKEGYHSAVDSVMKKYKAMKNVDNKELAAMAHELKGHWDAISREVSKARTKVVKVIPKVTKSVAKKVGVKTTKKASAKRKAPAKSSKKSVSKKRR